MTSANSPASSSASPHYDPNDAIDPTLYLHPPVLDVAGTLQLARALIDLAPSTPPPEVYPALRRLERAVEDLQAVNTKHRESPLARPENRQPADLLIDTAWTALYERLRAYAMLPEEQVPRVRRAQELLRVLFPDALGFLRLPYEVEWAESEQRIKTIEQLRLAPDLSAIAGPEFLPEVWRAHEHYSKVLGMYRTRGEPPESGPLRELRWALARTISHYALKVLGLADDDPVLVRKLLQPLADCQPAVQPRTEMSGMSGDGYEPVRRERF